MTAPLTQIKAPPFAPPCQPSGARHEIRFRRRSRHDPQQSDRHGRRLHRRGTPERLLDELVRQKKSQLGIIANDAAVPGRGVGTLIASLTASHIGLNPEAQKQMMAKKIAVDLVPQGTLVERIRAGGSGLVGVLTPTGAGTVVEEARANPDRRQALSGGDRPAFAVRADPCLPGRLPRQPFLCAQRAQLIPDPCRSQRFALLPPCAQRQIDRAIVSTQPMKSSDR